MGTAGGIQDTRCRVLAEAAGASLQHAGLLVGGDDLQRVRREPAQYVQAGVNQNLGRGEVERVPGDCHSRNRHAPSILLPRIE